MATAPSLDRDRKLYLEHLALLMATCANVSTRVHPDGTVHCHMHLDFVGSPGKYVFFQRACISCHETSVKEMLTNSYFNLQVSSHDTLHQMAYFAFSLLYSLLSES